MQILTKEVSLHQLRIIAESGLGVMVKAVVDVDLELIAIDAELHADLETLLLENGSRQESLWGINYFPELDEEDFIEFDSMINIRPNQGNSSRDVEDDEVRKRIVAITNKWIAR